MSGSSLHSVAQIRTLITDDKRRTAPLHVRGMTVGPIRTTTVTSSPLAASAIPNGLLLLNMPSSTTVALPSAVDIYAAFAAAGITLQAGDNFELPFQNISASYTATFTMGASLIDMQNIASTAIATPGAGSSGKLIFEYTLSGVTKIFNVFMQVSGV